MIGGVDFVWPGMLALLLLVPLIALAMYRGARLREHADRAYGGGDDLRVGRSRFLRGMRAALFLAALAVLITGIARPRWGTADAVVEQRGVDVVIALDVSRSMEAGDVAPNRNEAIVDGLRAMLGHMQGNRVGFVIFGETAFERSPLTLDTGAISTLLGRAQAESTLVRAGSSLAVGIEAALEVLDVEDPAVARAIIVASDGEDISGVELEPALEAAREQQIPVYALFAGGETPAQLGDSGLPEDMTLADRARMEQIAAASGTVLREPDTAAGLAVEFRRMGQTAFDSDVEQARIERFAWFVGAGLVLLVLQTLIPEASARRRERPRRGLMTAGAAGLLLVACSGTALWQHVDRGNNAYEEGRYEDALAAYVEAASVAEGSDHLPAVEYNSSNTLHQLQRYDEAVEGALAALETRSGEGETPAPQISTELSHALRYALGSHYYRLDDLEAARDALIAALRIDPTDEDAKANLELVLRELEASQPPAPEETPPPEGEPGDEGEGETGEGDEGEQPGGEPQEGEPSPEPGEEGEPGAPDGGSPGSGGNPETYEEALERLREMLGELGDELSAEEAQELLDNYQRLNELDRLPGTTPNQGPPPR